MPYQPDLAGTGFLLFNVLQAPRQLQTLAKLTEADQPLMAQVLDEAGRFAREVVAPLSRVGDEAGCRWNAGEVTTPPGFRQAYRAFVEAGWPSLACATEDGGQGLP
ncbi:MAG: acyl-CoA dehydrogenase, partial [Polaromonas sp.]|nr:acyl-CoA dehydrogenase [Polaromonas sp.]